MPYTVTPAASRRAAHRNDLEHRRHLRTTHEQRCLDVLYQLAEATAGDLVALNSALLAIQRLHHGSRVVRRTHAPNPRELHRRQIDRCIATMRRRVETLALETTNAEALLTLQYVAAGINRIGYR